MDSLTYPTPLKANSREGRDFPYPLLFIVSEYYECMPGEENRPPASLEVALHHSGLKFNGIQTLYVGTAGNQAAENSKKIHALLADMPDNTRVIALGYEAGKQLEAAKIPSFPMVSPMRDPRIAGDKALHVHLFATLGRIMEGVRPQLSWDKNGIDKTLPPGPDTHPSGFLEGYLKHVGWSIADLNDLAFHDFPTIERMSSPKNPAVDVERRRPFTRQYIVQQDGKSLETLRHSASNPRVSAKQLEAFEWRNSRHAINTKAFEKLPIPLLANHEFIAYINPKGDHAPAHIHIYHRGTMTTARIAMVENTHSGSASIHQPRFDVAPYFYTHQLISSKPQAPSPEAILVNEGWPQKPHFEKFNMSPLDLPKALNFVQPYAEYLMERWREIHPDIDGHIVNDDPDRPVSFVGLKNTARYQGDSWDVAPDNQDVAPDNQIATRDHDHTNAMQSPLPMPRRLGKQ
ncbi:MAG: hypothetical protein K2Q12_08080 [Rickettsiales bacterium]|nr:hypothetical protein [Rickettsiales bacterium]